MGYMDNWPEDYKEYLLEFFKEFRKTQEKMSWACLTPITISLDEWLAGERPDNYIK